MDGIGYCSNHIDPATPAQVQELIIQLLVHCWLTQGHACFPYSIVSSFLITGKFKIACRAIPPAFTVGLFKSSVVQFDHLPKAVLPTPSQC